MIKVTTICISLTHIKNNKGPRVDPCGTSHDMLETLEKAFSKFTVKLWFDKIRLKVFNSAIRTTNNACFFKSMSSLIKSNDFWMSIKIIPVTKPSSKPFKMLPFKKERHVPVEWFFLKLDWQSYKITRRLENSSAWSRLTLSNTSSKGSRNFDKDSRNIDLQFDWSVFQPFLNSGFNFAILQASGKLPNVMERLHDSLMGFDKIHAPSFKDFPEIWSIPAAFVTLAFFNILNR